jgi:membrane fusion protein, adhesin transport system
MLNISNNSISKHVNTSKYSTFTRVEGKVTGKVPLRLIGGTFAVIFIILLMPWTQNIRSLGKVSTLNLDQRPQTINSIIAGSIEKWYVKEGDFVQKGDTILFLSEIKDDYFDPQLLERTDDQRILKEQTADSYSDKVKALNNQIDALGEQKSLKLQQATLKFKQATLKSEIDSNAYLAAQSNYKIAVEQYKRMKELYDQGLKSLTDLETRDLKKQQTKAYEVEALNKWLGSKNDMISAKVDYSSVIMDYQNSLAKTNSDKSSALSDKFDAEATVSKLKNQYANYKFRKSYYYITAPQDGYVTKSIQAGIGEIIKEGEQLISLMPATYNLIVEMYVDPIDLPLVHIGNQVNIQFDGWPAIVFSGWPNASYGTFKGKVYAIDNFLGENGKFRVLVQPDKSSPPWPKALRVGGGTNGMMLLKDVSIWYELWRNINGFPPEYYLPKDKKVDKNEAK